MAPATKLIIFDLGNVLIPLRTERLIEALKRDSQRPQDELRALIHAVELVDPLERGQLSLEQFFAQIKKQLALTWEFEQFLPLWNDILVENATVGDLLGRLRPRYQLAAITNIDVVHEAYILNTWPAFRQIHHWVASCQVGLRKPQPEIYRLALERAGVAPSAAVYLDDRADFIEAAGRLGIRGVQVTHPSRVLEHLRELGIVWDGDGTVARAVS